MAYEKRTYKYEDLKKIDLRSAPSLDLPELIVDEFLVPKDGRKHMLFLTSVKKKASVKCPYCNGSNTIKNGKSKKRLVHDVIRYNYRVDIGILPQLYKCKDCNLKFTPTIDGIEDNRQMTTRLLEYLKVECFLQSHSVLAKRSGISIETVQNIMDDQIQIYEARRKEHPPEAPEVLGIDEKHIVNAKGGTLVDIDNGDLLDILVDNTPPTMINAIKSLAYWESNIKVVNIYESDDCFDLLFNFDETMDYCDINTESVLNTDWPDEELLYE